MSYRRKVLLESINFAPEHAGIGPYVTALARHLADVGWSVAVHTGVTHYPSWSVDDSMRFKLRRYECLGGFTVRRARHYVPRRQSAARRALYEATYAANTAATRWGDPPDVVVSVIPTLLGAAAQSVRTQRARVPHIIWLQDAMGRAAKESGISNSPTVAAVVARLETWTLRRAAHVVAIHGALGAVALEAGVDASRLSIIRNWAKDTPIFESSVGIVRRRMGWDERDVVVVHAGNMGAKQGLDVAIEAARRLDEHSRVRIVLLGEGSQRVALEQQARGVPRLSIMPPVPSADFMDVLRASDMLLVTERLGVKGMSMPSKLTSYFQAGRAVIASVDPDGSTAGEVKRSGAGVITPAGDVNMLSEAIDHLGRNRPLRDRLGARGWRYADTHLAPGRGLDAWGELLDQIARNRDLHSASALGERARSTGQSVKRG